MKAIAVACLSLFLVSCNTQKNEYNSKKMSEYTGLIKAQGITSYQYGTHTLETEDSLYALRSETIELDNYIEKRITLTAETIEGYPVDGGPKYLNVIDVQK